MADRVKSLQNFPETNMSQEELLTSDELDKFDKLLQKSSLVQREKRKALCYQININPGNLPFLDHTEESFATLLIRHLHDTRNKESFCILVNKIEKELQGKDWENDLETIRRQLKCSPSSFGSPPSVNPSHPNSPKDYSPKSPWKLLVKVVGGGVVGGVLLLVIRSAIFPKNPSPSHQSTPSTSNNNSSSPCSEGYTFDGSGPSHSGEYSGWCEPTSSNAGAARYECVGKPNTSRCSKR